MWSQGSSKYRKQKKCTRSEIPYICVYNIKRNKYSSNCCYNDLYIVNNPFDIGLFLARILSISENKTPRKINLLVLTEYREKILT